MLNARSSSKCKSILEASFLSCAVKSFGDRTRCEATMFTRIKGVKHIRKRNRFRAELSSCSEPSSFPKQRAFHHEDSEAGPCWQRFSLTEGAFQSLHHALCCYCLLQPQFGSPHHHSSKIGKWRLQLQFLAVAFLESNQQPFDYVLSDDIYLKDFRVLTN